MNPKPVFRYAFSEVELMHICWPMDIAGKGEARVKLRH